MARKQTLDLIIKTFQELGGNLNDVLGTRTNINFLGKGKSPELMLDMDINVDALGVLPQSKAVEELTSSVGYALSNKLNDVQANKLLDNMTAMKNFYIPPAAPKNVTDFATGTPELDKAGLMSLRQGRGDLVRGDPDLPPPGSRGGPEDISAPFASAEETMKNLAKAEGITDVNETILPTGAGLELLKNVKNNNLIINDVVDTIYMNIGVSKAAQPAARGNAREFLNRVKDLEDPTNPSGPTLSSIMEVDDFKFMTEGGGGGMGDPMLLVQKYFGPKVASAVAQLDNADDIQKFAERLVGVRDAKGNTITSRSFDPDTVDDFEFADGGRVPMFAGGAARMGYQALRKYGFEAKDITRMFKELAVDKSLQGKEKTLYFQTLNKALKNPEEFPDTIKEMQLKLGIDVGTGFKSGGLAGILEV
jgi:hypothetical protein